MKPQLKPPRKAFDYHCKVVSISGTVATIECQSGHRFANDLAKVRVGHPLSTAVVAKLARYWSYQFTIACKRCEHERNFRFRRPVGYRGEL